MREVQQFVVHVFGVGFCVATLVPDFIYISNVALYPHVGLIFHARSWKIALREAPGPPARASNSNALQQEGDNAGNRQVENAFEAHASATLKTIVSRQPWAGHQRFKTFSTGRRYDQFVNPPLPAPTCIVAPAITKFFGPVSK